MRIVIDLQAAQQDDPQAAATALQLGLDLVRGAGQAHVIVALSHRYPHTIAALRHAFSDSLPASQVMLYDLPSLNDAGHDALPWLAQASAALRAAFFATLRPDLVFVPALDTSDPRCVDGSDSRYRTVRQMAAGAPPAIAVATDADTDVVGVNLSTSETDGATLWRWFDMLTAPNSTTVAAPTSSALATAAAPRRPTLAYLSPLPPQKSGIADYSAELLPELARYYDVEVIIDQPEVSDAWISTNLPLRTVAWFEQHAAGYDRVMYHFGNSPMHQHMFGLLQRHPGIVVLHDFYLSNLLDYMHHTGYQPDAGVQALFDAHGFSGVMEQQRIGEVPAVWHYPSNRAVLEQAQGVIVHSAFPKQLASQWYGPQMAADWHTLPLLRGQAGSDRNAARQTARQQLGIDEPTFLVCSFGMLGPTKLNEKLLAAWQQSALAADTDCQLVYVGQLGGENHGRDLPAKIAAGKGKKRITITGFVTPAMYQTYLAACDVAVQLRTSTRGETSAAVLDCLLHGVPTVANAHGSTAELPDDVLCMLTDEFELDALSAALLQLRDQPELRARLAQAGAAYIREHHAPAQVGQRYYAAIEDIAQRSPDAHYRRLLAQLRALGPAPAPQHLLATAAAVASNLPSRAPRQLFIDISAMVQTDLRTGIQRVVRSILHALLRTPPAGYQVEPVYSPGHGQPYRYARGYMQKTLRAEFDVPDDAPIDVRTGDIFVGLDLMMHGTQQNAALLRDMRNRGAQVYFVVYDILPVPRPDVFPFGAEADFAAWLGTIAAISDGLVCISRAVADELADWLATHPPARPDPVQLGYFHLGADIDASAPSTGLPEDADHILAEVARRPTMLIVGTVEPRKGHAQALAAFDMLWQEGMAVNLVIVGKHGWMVDAVTERMKRHPQLGQQLFWLQGASDEMLLKLYQAASGLLIPSEGEGFGLPLIEAAQHGIPILARDLPVFREVAAEHASYFSGLSAAELATALRSWFIILKKNKVPPSTGMRWLTWAESADELLSAITRQRWYRHLAAPSTTAASAEQ